MCDNYNFVNSKQLAMGFVKENVKNFEKAKIFVVVNGKSLCLDEIERLGHALDVLAPRETKIEIEIKIDLDIFLELKNEKYQWLHFNLDDSGLSISSGVSVELDSHELIDHYHTWQNAFKRKIYRIFDENFGPKEFDENENKNVNLLLTVKLFGAILFIYGFISGIIVMLK